MSKVIFYCGDDNPEVSFEVTADNSGPNMTGFKSGSVAIEMRDGDGNMSVDIEPHDARALAHLLLSEADEAERP